MAYQPVSYFDADPKYVNTNGALATDAPSQQVVRMGSHPDVEASGSFWISTWVFSTELDGFRPIVSKYRPGVDEYFIRSQNGELQFYVRRGDDSAWDILRFTDRNILAGKWNHIIAFADQGTQKLRVYLDGLFMEADGYSSYAVGDNGFSVGANSIHVADQYWSGRIAHVAFGKPPGPIAAVEREIVQTLYNGGNGLALDDLEVEARATDWGCVNTRWNLQERSGPRESTNVVHSLNPVNETGNDMSGDGIPTLVSLHARARNPFYAAGGYVKGGVPTHPLDVRNAVIEPANKALASWRFSDLLSRYVWRGDGIDMQLNPDFDHAVSNGAYSFFISGKQLGLSSSGRAYDDGSGRNDGTLTNFADLKVAYRLETPDGSYSSVLADSGSGGNDGQMTGFADVDAARSDDVPAAIGSGKSLEHNGTSEYVYNGTDNWQAGDTQGCITAWIKTTSTSRCVFGSAEEGNPSNWDWFGFLQYPTNTMCLQLRSQVGTSATLIRGYGSTPINDGTWHLVAIESNGSAWKMYIDGVDEGPLSTDATANSGEWLNSVNIRSSFSIGALVRNTVSNFWDGGLDDVRYYDQPLTPTEHANLYNGIDPAATPVGHWTFDDPPRSVPNIAGGRSLEFPKSNNEYIDITGTATDIANLTVGSVTFWAKINDDNSEQAAISFTRRADNTLTRILLLHDMRSENKIAYECRIDGGIPWIFSGDLDSSISSEWALFSIVHDGSEPKMYANGVPVSGSFSTSNDLTKWFKAIFTDATNKADAIMVGLNDRGGSLQFPFNGNLDDLRIYDIALPPSDILNLYNGIDPAAVPVGRWKLDGAQGLANWGEDGSESANAARNLTAGDGVYFDLTTDPDPEEDDFVIEGWVNLKSSGTTQSIFATGASANRQEGVWVYIDTGRRLALLMNDSVQTSRTPVSFSNTLTVDQWAHVAVVFDRDGNAEGFLNGSSIGVGDISLQAATLGSSGGRIGASVGSGGLMNGLLSRLRYYRGPAGTAEKFTAGKVAELYNNGDGLTAEEVQLDPDIGSHLVHGWNGFEEDKADPLRDKIGTNDGTVVTTELITNGTFDSDTGWTKGTGWTISGGTANCDGSQASATSIYQDAGLTIGNSYSTLFTVKNYSAGNVNCRCGSGTDGTSRSANGTYEETLICTGDSFAVIVGDTNFIGSVDDISFKASGIPPAPGPGTALDRGKLMSFGIVNDKLQLDIGPSVLNSDDSVPEDFNLVASYPGSGTLADTAVHINGAASPVSVVNDRAYATADGAKNFAVSLRDGHGDLQLRDVAYMNRDATAPEIAAYAADGTVPADADSWPLDDTPFRVADQLGMALDRIEQIWQADTSLGNVWQWNGRTSSYVRPRNVWDLSGSFTIGWSMRTVNPGVTYIYARFPTDPSWRVYTNGSVQCFYQFHDGTTSLLYSFAIVSDDVWRDYRIVFDRDNETIKVFIDGSEVDSKVIPAGFGNPTGSNTFKIGQRSDQAETFPDWIANAKFWDYAIDPTGPEPEPLDDFPLNEGPSGNAISEGAIANTWFDRSAYRNHARQEGTFGRPYWTAFTGDGSFLDCLVFDGVDDLLKQFNGIDWETLGDFQFFVLTSVSIPQSNSFGMPVDAMKSAAPEDFVHYHAFRGAAAGADAGKVQAATGHFPPATQTLTSLAASIHNEIALFDSYYIRGSVYRLFKNGVLQEEIVPPGSWTWVDAFLTLGGRSVTSDYFYLGRINTVIAFNKYIGDDQTAAVREFITRGKGIVLP